MQLSVVIHYITFSGILSAQVRVQAANRTLKMIGSFVFNFSSDASQIFSSDASQIPYMGINFKTLITSLIMIGFY